MKLRTYIIHVSDHLQREQHIKGQVESLALDTAFVNEGDISDLSREKLEKYFKGNMARPSATSSCAFKHLLAFERIIAENIDHALILEDDIIFYPNSDNIINRILQETKRHDINNYILSLEDSTLKYIGRSARIPGRVLYPKIRIRLAGAYIIDQLAARHILSYIKQHKCDIPIDLFIDDCSRKEIVDVYWSQPTVAVQGSLLGNIPTLIDDKPSGLFRIISFKTQRIYKRLLYYFR